MASLKSETNMTTDTQQSAPDKPPIEQALNWLASHSGEYSVVLLDYIAELESFKANTQQSSNG